MHEEDEDDEEDKDNDKDKWLSPTDAAVLFCEAQHHACVLCSCPPMYMLVSRSCSLVFTGGLVNLVPLVNLKQICSVFYF